MRVCDFECCICLLKTQKKSNQPNCIQQYNFISLFILFIFLTKTKKKHNLKNCFFFKQNLGYLSRVKRKRERENFNILKINFLFSLCSAKKK